MNLSGKGQTLKSLIANVSVTVARGISADNRLITSITQDSRAVKLGAMFIARSGNKQDGNLFIDEAINRGAIAVLSELKLETKILEKFPEVAFLYSENISTVFPEIVARFYGEPSRKIFTIGITGTNGKTSTSWILAHALAYSVRDSAGYIGTLGYFVNENGKHTVVEQTGTTTPEAVQLQSLIARTVASGAKYLVCEVSSHAIHQKRIASVHWDLGVFTNITRDHLDYHKTFQAYAGAKKQLFTEGLVTQSKKQNRIAVLNADDEFSAEILKEVETIGKGIVKCFTYSVSNNSNSSGAVIRAEVLRNGSNLEFEILDEKLRFKSALIGDYNVENMLCAATVLRVMGFSGEEVSKRLSVVPPVPGRLEYLSAGGVAVYVDYAHTPDALVQAQKSLRRLFPRKLITVFGCGGDRDRGKRKLMGEAVRKYSDFAIITSDNPRSEVPEDIIADIIPGVEVGGGADFSYEAVVSREEAIYKALTLARKGDMILVAGKGHEDYQEINGVRHPFCDRGVVTKAVRELGFE